MAIPLNHPRPLSCRSVSYTHLDEYKRQGLEKGELALGGSVLLKTDLLRKRLEERLKERYGEMLVREPIAGAADGALRMAKEAVGSPFGRIGKETGV